MSTATARMTLGSVFGAVTSATEAVSSTFDTATKAVGMMNKFVSDASEKQRIRSIVDMADFSEKLAEEKAMEETLRKKAILEFTKESPENKELFQNSYDRIKSLLEAD